MWKYKEKGECIACSITDDFVWMAPCKHGYCDRCLIRYYDECLKDFTRVPAQCCNVEFPDEWKNLLLTGVQVEKYDRMEFERFSVNSSAGQEGLYIQIVRRNGWRLCRECGVGVEKVSGCYHITCKCGYRFCWICEGPWNSESPCNCLD